MEIRETLLLMVKKLLEDIASWQQQGAGYYSCIPMAKRYNKLLAQARTLFPPGHGLVGTFDDLPESDPKDPGEKMKVVQSIRIEIGQLIALLEAVEKGKP